MNEIRPSAEWKQVPHPDEAKAFEDFASFIVRQQDKAADQLKAQGHNGQLPLRGFHAKTHAGMRAKFTVVDGLPDFARFGLFREPREFDAVVRFSNGKPSRERDRGKEPRGIAIKVFGVEGSKVAEHEGQETQDFLATSHSVTATVRNAGQFFEFVRASEAGILMPIKLIQSLGFAEARRILKALVFTVILPKVHSMATESYSGTAPIKYGPYAVKFTVQPAADTPPAPAPTNDPDFLKQELLARLRQGDIRFDFMVQFYTNDGHTPIEDTSVVWAPENSPPVKVAALTIPRLTASDEVTERFTEWVDQLSFSPWHALAEHEPLGSIMRARRVAYAVSAKHRKVHPEPKQIIAL
jgi:hypothetical protein